MKDPVNKLKIVKNKRTTDANGQFNYVFEWSYNGNLLYQEVKKMSADIYNRPIEEYNVNDLIEHKKICCCDIVDPLEVEIVEI